MTSVHRKLDAFAALGIALQSLYFCVHPLQDRVRKVICKVKSDVLNGLRTFEVGKIAAAVPEWPGANAPV